MSEINRSREFDRKRIATSRVTIIPAAVDARRQSSEETPLLGNGGDIGSVEDTGSADLAEFPWWRRPSIFWLLPAFFIVALSFGGIIVPKLNLVLSLICKDYLAERARADPSYILMPVILDADNPQCRIPEVQALATQFMLYATMLTGAMSAIMSPKLGAWSDRYGRTRFLALASFGPFMAEIITILAAKYPEKIRYQWLLLGAIFDGALGSFTASMAITFAYVSDCTSPQRRVVSFSYFHACLFSGMAIGPLIAALLLRLTGKLLYIFYFALGVHAIFILFILCIVPESLTRKRQTLARQAFVTTLASTTLNRKSWLRPVTTLFDPLKILWPTGPGTSSRLRRNLSMLAVVDTISFGIALGVMTVIVYYVGYQFGWDSKQSSLFMSTVSISRVTALLIILPMLNYFWRARRRNAGRQASGFEIPERNSGSDSTELSIVRLALILEVIGFAGYAVARNGWLFVLGGVFASLGGIGSPTLQGALTNHVPPERVGQLLGAMGLLHALARIVAPAVANFIYLKTVKVFPQSIFVVLCASFGVAFVASLFVRPNVCLDDPDVSSASISNTAMPNLEAEVILDEEVTGI